MNGQGKVTKTETILLGMTAVFLCILLAMFLRDRHLAETVGVETARTAPQEAVLPEQAPLDLNSADASALETLPGIGPELAKRIVEYRLRNGPFSTVEELMEVPGIGQGKLEGLRGDVTVAKEGTT